MTVAASPAVVERGLDDAGIAFLFAPSFHPSMRHAGPIRRELGIRTAFNVLGPLTNPAGARRQVVGVPRPELADLVARALAELGAERAWVVHGAEGLDEISVVGHTKVCEVHAGTVSTFYVHPSDFGLTPTTIDRLRVDGLDDSVRIARSVLAAEAGPARDFVLANAAAGLVVAGRAGSLPDGVRIALDALRGGRAAATLERMAQCSRGPEGQG